MEVKFKENPFLGVYEPRLFVVTKGQNIKFEKSKQCGCFWKGLEVDMKIWNYLKKIH